MSESRMGGGDLPAGADVEVIRAWASLGAFDPTRDGAVSTTASEGRIIILAPSPEAAHEGEEVARAHEEMHEEQRETLMRAVCEALARGVAAGPGPWAVGNPASARDRQELRRAGFEERHDEKLGTVWVRPADGRTMKPQEAPFVVPAEPDPRGGRSG